MINVHATNLNFFVGDDTRPGWCVPAEGGACTKLNAVDGECSHLPNQDCDTTVFRSLYSAIDSFQSLYSSSEISSSEVSAFFFFFGVAFFAAFPAFFSFFSFFAFLAASSNSFPPFSSHKGISTSYFFFSSACFFSYFFLISLI